MCFWFSYPGFFPFHFDTENVEIIKDGGKWNSNVFSFMLIISIQIVMKNLKIY